MSHAAHFVDEAIEILLFHGVFYCLKDFECAGSFATGGGSNENHCRLVIPYRLPAGLRLLSYFFEIQLFSLSSCSFLS
jgi:hypothetical protein